MLTVAAYFVYYIFSVAILIKEEKFYAEKKRVFQRKGF